jgi:two-component system CheB/CheR fusion protein
MFEAVRPAQKPSFTIALVEDHRDTRDWMRTCLQEEFFVSAHETARDLLAFVSANPCNLILSDISLPDMNGYDLLAAIRSNPALSHLPVIAISAHFTQADCEMARRAGFDESFVKPVDLDMLFTAIKRFLPRQGMFAEPD